MGPGADDECGSNGGDGQGTAVMTGRAGGGCDCDGGDSGGGGVGRAAAADMNEAMVTVGTGRL